MLETENARDITPNCCESGMELTIHEKARNMNYYLYVLKNYALFTGRARRKEYWMFVLFNFIVAFVLGFIGGMIHVTFIGLLYNLAVLVPSIAVAIRRMHDTDHSGWWVL